MVPVVGAYSSGTFYRLEVTFNLSLFLTFSLSLFLFVELKLNFGTHAILSFVPNQQPTRVSNAMKYENNTSHFIWC